MKARHIISLVLLAAVGAVVVPPLLRLREQSAATAALESTVKEFGSVHWEESDAGLKSGKFSWGTRAAALAKGDLPTLTGRVLLLRPTRQNYGAGKARELPPMLEPLFFELPAELRARTRAEVRTLVQVYPDTTPEQYQEVGGTRQATLTKLTAQLRFYDVSSKTLLGIWSVEGDTPPDKFREDEWPKLAAPPIVEFLEALPRAQ